MNKKAPKNVGLALISYERMQELRHGNQYPHLRTRLATYEAMLTEQLDETDWKHSREKALQLAVIAGFCWQVLRTLGGRKGDDEAWLQSSLPTDHEQSDKDIGDSYYASQTQIQHDARWLFGLNSELRHPANMSGDTLGLLRHPPDTMVTERLARAAQGIQQVLLSVAARFTS